MIVQQINQQQFKEKVMEYDPESGISRFVGNLPTVVSFYASWCGPCKALAPTMEALAEEYEGKVDFYKVDVENSRALANDFRVRSVPTIVFFSRNSDPHNFVGYYSKSELRFAVERLINL